MKKHLAIIVETNGDTDTYEKISWKWMANKWL